MAQFTGKEQDAESGLDYFGARYYGSALGRFTSPDEFKGGFENLNGTPAFSPGPIGYADLTDPQTLNMYVYTRNNPLRYIDPDGHDIWDYLTGVGNAFSSDNLGGAGRTSGGNEDFRLGQTVGDAVATITGSLEVLSGGGEAVVTSPAALTGVGALVPAAGIAEAAHGATTVGVAGGHLADVAFSKRTGDFTKGEKNAMDAKNAADNGGVNKCTSCGQEVQKVQNKAGEPTPGNQLQRHHDPPLSKRPPGTKSPKDRILCKDCHVEEHRNN